MVTCCLRHSFTLPAIHQISFKPFGVWLKLIEFSAFVHSLRSVYFIQFIEMKWNHSLRRPFPIRYTHGALRPLPVSFHSVALLPFHYTSSISFLHFVTYIPLISVATPLLGLIQISLLQFHYISFQLTHHHTIRGHKVSVWIMLIHLNFYTLVLL